MPIPLGEILSPLRAIKVNSRTLQIEQLLPLTANNNRPVAINYYDWPLIYDPHNHLSGRGNPRRYNYLHYTTHNGHCSSSCTRLFQFTAISTSTPLSSFCYSIPINTLEASQRGKRSLDLLSGCLVVHSPMPDVPYLSSGDDASFRASSIHLQVVSLCNFPGPLLVEKEKKIGSIGGSPFNESVLSYFSSLSFFYSYSLAGHQVQELPIDAPSPSTSSSPPPYCPVIRSHNSSGSCRNS